MEEKENKEEKVFTAIIVSTIMDTVNTIHDYQIPREDIVSILPDKEGYVIFCYK